MSAPLNNMPVFPVDRREGGFDLSGAAAIVTGAARGLGLATAHELGKAGAKILIADLDGPQCQASVNELVAEGIDADAHEANIGGQAQSERLIKHCVERYGRIDILVNNAGSGAGTPLRIEEVTEEHFDRVMEWNVRSAFFCSKAVLPHMRAQGGGSIVNLTSIAGRAGFDLVSPQYSASKAAIVGLTQNLAKTVGRDGIRVNAVAPGFIKTGPRQEAIWQSYDEDAVLRDVALGRRGEPSDVAQAVLYLASAASKYVTGAIIDVNGGYLTA